MTYDDPLVSIVTPSYNSKSFIMETVKSVDCQTYEHIEHLIIDGESTDGTVDLLQRYEDEYDYEWVSESDNGMYDAISKGFARANGDICAWLNTDDIYFPWTIQVVVEWLTRDGVEWITGVPAHIDKAGILKRIATIIPRYRREWIRHGWYHGRGLGFIFQEATFWTRSLWDSRGGFPKNVRLSGDFHLWKNFAKESELVTVPTILAAFRHHEEQLTSDLDMYYAEIGSANDILPRIFSQLKLHQMYSIYKHVVDRKTASMSDVGCNGTI